METIIRKIQATYYKSRINILIYTFTEAQNCLCMKSHLYTVLMHLLCVATHVCDYHHLLSPLCNTTIHSLHCIYCASTSISLNTLHSRMLHFLLHAICNAASTLIHNTFIYTLSTPISQSSSLTEFNNCRH
ncbi:hypothetical protein HK407_12g16690 [Ordospora pajunii]|uniref:uncharacterized protein n=1 Tax=Ordospora pajunii TaxID=3039483 RepID=UPI0029527C33|nr:uncharacterized protein HK407_12g16690 [Ordospora pajunii]KAH9410540.1 hypothetical protein HK407_12g16690 [Ordospora pajunii]